ncbi:hypothetical protein B0181_00140 [Moraxella caviae]|uniref:Uncharacterized protein n=1 Tax=Moraxella caviae TaxID=34060 RepID=A0A1T0ADW4_9GAMM|nr:hypothetical protein B0181_00140 [Moraxella caviae]
MFSHKVILILLLNLLLSLSVKSVLSMWFLVRLARCSLPSLHCTIKLYHKNKTACLPSGFDL